MKNQSNQPLRSKIPCLNSILASMFWALIGLHCTIVEAECLDHDPTCNVFVAYLALQTGDLTLVERFLFAGNTGTQDISQFRIDAAGALTLIGTTATSSGNPQEVVVDSTSSNLYVSTNTDFVDHFSIDATTGSLTFKQTIASGAATTRYMGLHPSGTALHVANSGGVAMFSINSSNGSLSSLGTAPAGTGAREIAAHPDGAYAFAANSGGDISYYTTNSDGTLNFVNNLPGGTAFDTIAIDATGTNLYAPDGGANNIRHYNVTSGVPSFSATTGSGTSPIQFIPHASGFFGYSVDNGGPSLTLYSIGIDGGLTSISNTVVGASPTLAAASEKFLFVGCTGPDTIHMFSINASTGELTSISNPISSSGLNPNTVAIASYYE